MTANRCLKRTTLLAGTLLFALALAGALLLAAAAAHADTLTVSDDAFLKLDKPAENNGDKNEVQVDNTKVGKERHGFVRFDLTPLPVGITPTDIERAILRMWVQDVKQAGVITPTTKAELEKAEADREKLLAALKVDTRSHKVLDFLPHAMDRYRQLVNNLGDIKDVARARAQIKHLLGGQVKLIPTEQGYLEAELKGDYAGLCKLAVNSGAEERT